MLKNCIANLIAVSISAIARPNGLTKALDLATE